MSKNKLTLHLLLSSPMISPCRRQKALQPTPYDNSILTSNMPSRQYAISSGRVVLRRETQAIQFATDVSLRAPIVPEGQVLRFQAQHLDNIRILSSVNSDANID